MNIACNVKDFSRRVKNTIINNIKTLVFLAVALLVGLVLGFIFYNSILTSELLFWNDKEGILFVIKQTKFFPYFFSLFWLYLRALLCAFVFCLFKNGKWGLYFLALLNGLTFAVLLVTVISLLGVIGIGYLVITVLMFAFLLLLLFFSFCIAENNSYCGVLVSKNKLLYLTKYFIILLISSVIYSLLITIIVFLLLRLLFAIV